ncbi:hypothetical protein [Priestia koreensis]|uniref:hypothetical protein n=1 Tax=Priestia koreensis TaxID=284581 RepID=UPI003459E714
MTTIGPFSLPSAVLTMIIAVLGGLAITLWVLRSSVHLYREIAEAMVSTGGAFLIGWKSLPILFHLKQVQKDLILALYLPIGNSEKILLLLSAPCFLLWIIDRKQLPVSLMLNAILLWYISFDFIWFIFTKQIGGVIQNSWVASIIGTYHPLSLYKAFSSLLILLITVMKPGYIRSWTYSFLGGGLLLIRFLILSSL